MNVREYMNENTLLFDGAFGTWYAIRYEGSYEACELENLAHPERVGEIHREYIKAGAKAIKTNTFGAYPIAMGGEERQAEVIRKGFAIAGACRREAGDAGKEVFVFADLGPAPGETPEEITDAYLRAAEIFLEEGAENFLFETQSTDIGLREAAAHIREKKSDAVIFASFGVLPDGFSRDGRFYRTMLEDLWNSGLFDAVGLNCVSSAGHMKQLLAGLAERGMNLTAMPNAGYPTVRGFRTYFENSPEYFAGKVMEIADLGVGILGGCCGTTPDYIRELSAQLSRGKVRPAKFVPRTAVNVSREEVPSPKKILINNRFAQKIAEGKCVFAVELDSPKNADATGFMDDARRLKEAGADTITIADCPIARARMDSSLLACKVKRELDLDVIPHMTCRDRNVNATKALLLGLYAENIRNVLIVTGDPIPTAERDEVKSVYHFNSRKLGAFVNSLNEETFREPIQVFGALDVNAVNFPMELKRAKEKEAAGMVGFLTQPVLSEEALENLKLARKELTGWLLGGIIPVVSHRNAVFMNNEINGITVSQEIIDRYEGLERKEAEDLAVEISGEIAGKIRPYIDGYYLMTPMRRISLMERILQKLQQTEK